MTKFIIEGGHSLEGTVDIRGAKNAATPILAATLLTSEPCTLMNVPRITDVLNMIKIMESMGVEVEWLGPHEVSIQSKNLNPVSIDKDLVCSLRSSALFFGSLTARSQTFTLPDPGGCQIGARPLDAHLDALKQFGVSVEYTENAYAVDAHVRHPANFFFSEMSVTATENALMVASTIDGKTVLRGAAAEPTVQDLCWFLQKMGARISGIGTHTLTVQGTQKLQGVTRYEIMPDPIETGTFIALAASSRSHIVLEHTAPEFIEMELSKFQEAGVRLTIKDVKHRGNQPYQHALIEVKPSSKLQAIRKVHSMPYPGFATDLLPPFAVMVTQAHGTTLIHDWMFEGRLKYVDELVKMGANATICDPHRALIVGPTPLTATEITSFDIRAGATLIIAALIAHGTSTINNAEQADRGYEMIDERLKKLGASMRRQS